MLQHFSGSRGEAALRMAGVAGLALLVAGLNISWSILPHRKPHPADMTQRATAVGPLLPANARRSPAVAAAAARPSPQPTPAPTPKPKPAPRRRHAPADMTQRATAVGPVLTVKSKHPTRAKVDAEASADAAPAPTPQTPPSEPPPPEAQEVHRIGVVKVIGAGGAFLLIEARDTFSSADLPTGTELRCRGSAATGGEQTALLRVSPERRDPFIVADIVSGTPQVGDGIYLPEAASKPR